MTRASAGSDDLVPRMSVLAAARRLNSLVEARVAGVVKAKAVMFTVEGCVGVVSGYEGMRKYLCDWSRVEIVSEREIGSGCD
jgi:hypothetical protein